MVIKWTHGGEMYRASAVSISPRPHRNLCVIACRSETRTHSADSKGPSRALMFEGPAPSEMNPSCSDQVYLHIYTSLKNDIK